MSVLSMDLVFAVGRKGIRTGLFLDQEKYRIMLSNKEQIKFLILIITFGLVEFKRSILCTYI